MKFLPFANFCGNFYIAILSDLTSTRRWIFLCEFVNKFFTWGRRNGGYIDIFRICAYQGWVCHVGVTMIRWSVFFLKILVRTRLIKLHGGKAKSYSLFKGSRNISIAILPRSGFNAMYHGRWWHSLDANRSRIGCPMCVLISWKSETSSLHSELSLAFRYSVSACTFRAPRRYSTDSGICLLRR